ncbi:hypothetical protein GGR50DRAFT_681818 [Xylaria sp. CBS 124048]|nr:hypothetical protein GGR50DRAFT_681818 [Xylaria sp. CBS 124048]
MGLSGPRNRRKLDYDPNNTKWTRDETTFGQKILRAQGWEPGKFLGAQDTSQAKYHSVASLAPIKVSMKDDTLGLGAKIRQKQSDECTGLDVFKDLLGRLNGKSEETLQKEKQVRSEIKTNLYVERKYGPMRFVSGGLLVGDQMMAKLINSQPTSTSPKDESTSEASEVESVRKDKKEKRERKEKKSKKRKASESEETDASDSRREKKREKRTKAKAEPDKQDVGGDKPEKRSKSSKEKKSRRSERAPEAEEDAEPVEAEVTRKKSKKSKEVPNQAPASNVTAGTSEDTTVPEKSRKEKKKDKKRKQAGQTEASATTAPITSSTTTLASTPQESGSSTPRSIDTSTTMALSARHRARSRNIASKKLAFGDMQALNQVCRISQPLYHF